ncbi:hypothetical protein QVD17_31059 [Tagetes erecta]|uniref:SWIM-type domain-containing protein n=1 Tax=Tagetes erecta TaxID=13708 RepID=A0AAD8K5G4_TARER|nr:hypothetical protein QVD17_31059 [Tagetes erecta]
MHQIFRAKAMAIKKQQGDHASQYAMLRDYGEEILRSNPGSTVKIDVERECNPAAETRQFKRIYICLGALKKGFKDCGRDLLGLDGCFLKGQFPGQILTAVGVDPNNGILPLAYAIVEAETLDSWKWFLSCLGDDLDLYSNSNFTFISDRQKGIIPALKDVFPSAEHRYCLRHIHENMKPRWRGQMYKELLWSCASATTVQSFEKRMKHISTVDPALHDWLKEIPPKHWCRSHFSGRAKCDVLLNNLCEVFNKQLVGGRDKPVITCLEYIREYLMRRHVIVLNCIAKWVEKGKGPLTPNATELFEVIKSEASQYKVIFNGHNKYQVTSSSLDQCVVNMDDRSCSCRKWELTGMPCKHAVAVNWNMRSNGIDVGIPETWVHKSYWLDTWKKVYSHSVDPINGKEMWPPSQCPTRLLPPKFRVQIGRPKKKRKKSAEELREKSREASESMAASIQKTGRMSRKGQSVMCSKCKKTGHNKRSCGKQPAQASANHA